MKRFLAIATMLFCLCAPVLVSCVAAPAVKPGEDVAAAANATEPEGGEGETVAELAEPPVAKPDPAVLELPPGPIAADDALRLLKAGNARYASGEVKRAHQGADRRADTAKNGQHPFATVLGCSDSRVPVEMLFDQGVGDLFVVRTAGNVAGPDELATIEYGVGHLGTPVVLVLGHTGCGAVTAAVENAHVHGNLPALINQIRPAVTKARTAGGDILSQAIKANVWLVMENILRKSSEVREAVKDGRVLLIGGIYNLTSGKVEWLGQHPEQGRLLAGPSVASKPRPKPKPKPRLKPKAAKVAKAGKAAAKPSAKPHEAVKNAKQAAKAPAPAPATPDVMNPSGHSDGDGSLLGPGLDTAPSKKKHK